MEASDDAHGQRAVPHPSTERGSRLRSPAGLHQSGFFVERDILSFKKGFLIAPTLFGSSNSEPNRIDNELAVYALSTLIDDHVRPPGFEVHVLTDFESRLGKCCGWLM